MTQNQKTNIKNKPLSPDLLRKTNAYWRGPATVLLASRKIVYRCPPHQEAQQEHPGDWTIAAAIDESVPAPLLSAALYGRCSSRGEDDVVDKLLSALRYQFGGHEEKTTAKKGVA